MRNGPQWTATNKQLHVSIGDIMSNDPNLRDVVGRPPLDLTQVETSLAQTIPTAEFIRHVCASSQKQRSSWFSGLLLTGSQRSPRNCRWRVPRRWLRSRMAMRHRFAKHRSVRRLERELRSAMAAGISAIPRRIS